MIIMIKYFVLYWKFAGTRRKRQQYNINRITRADWRTTAQKVQTVSRETVETIIINITTSCVAAALR